MLATYAAVAITNARFYQQITERDEVLTRRNENLALLNELATVLAGSDNIDQVLSQVLIPRDGLPAAGCRRGVPAPGRRQNPRTFHSPRRQPYSGCVTRQQFLFSEGMVGETAETGLMMTLDLNELRKQTIADEWAASA